MIHALLALVAFAAIRRFGWIDGLAIVTAVYLLMPWGPKYTARALIEEAERKRALDEAKRRGDPQ